MIVKDSELDKHFTYFLCAYYFHWTPEQVDKTEAYLLETMLIMLPGWLKRESEGKSND